MGAVEAGESGGAVENPDRAPPTTYLPTLTINTANAQANNFQKWIKYNSYEKDIEDMKEWLTLRMAWMDAQLSE